MANSHKTIIHLQKGTELTAAVDRMLRVEARKVFLVVPDEARIAQHILNFQLLKREAETVHKEIIIVSSNPRIQGLASKAGLQVHQLSEDFVYWDEGTESAQEQTEDIVFVQLKPKKVSDILVPPARKRADTTPPPSSLKKSKRFAHIQRRVSGLTPPSSKKSGYSADGAGLQESALRRFARQIPEPQSAEWKERVGSGGYRSFLPKKRARIRIPSFSFPFVSLVGNNIVRIALILFVVFTLGVGGVVLYTVLPTVRIVVTPHAQPIDITTPIRIDISRIQVDMANHVIPGQILEERYMQTQTFASSGRENIEEYATGKIRVYNEYSSAPQTLVATTRFVSQNGLLFRTKNTVVIPGAGVEGGKIIPSSALVEVQAAEPGDKYNISDATFSIPGFKGTAKFTGFYGKLDGAMSGGFKGTAQVVTETDLTKAEQALLSAAEGRASDRLRASIPSSYFLAPDALSENVLVLQTGAEAGRRIDIFEGKVEVLARAVIFRQEDVDAVIDYYFENEYGELNGIRLLPQRDISFTFIKKDFEREDFTLELGVHQNLGATIDPDALRDQILGKREGEVRSFIANYQGLKRAQVKFWPFWVHTVPANKDKVFITVRYLEEER